MILLPRVVAVASNQQLNVYAAPVDGLLMHRLSWKMRTLLVAWSQDIQYHSQGIT